MRHFRTIGSAEVEVPVQDLITLVGPNNSGKTNILRAIEMFFTGHDNVCNFENSRDLPFGSSNVKSSFLATFTGEFERVDTGGELDGSNSFEYSGPDAKFYGDFDRLCALYGREPSENVFTLSLVFSPSGTPVYQFFPNLKKPNDGASQSAISRAQKQLVADLLGRFACHYIPSAKSMEQLYAEVLNPFLTKIAAETVEPQVENLNSALSDVAKGINSELKSVGLSDLNVGFSLPVGGVEALLSKFKFELSDPVKTVVEHKGQGIQSTAFIAALKWVASVELKAGRTTVWLLEEPESYLHPELMGTVRGLIDRLSRHSQVVISTHSLAFVPSSVDEVRGVSTDDSGSAILTKFDTAVEAGARIRQALGVRFSDYYNLGVLNVAVEGPSDRDAINWILSILPTEDFELPLLREAEIFEFGGTTHLGGWLRATYPLIRKERALVTLFDGDTAGEKVRSDLTSYFGRLEIPFQSNREYVVVRSGFPVEALFPDDWILDLQTQHPSWFVDAAFDASGSLQSLRMEDRHKSSIMRSLMRRAEEDSDKGWLSRFKDVVRALESALAVQTKKLDSVDAHPELHD